MADIPGRPAVLHVGIPARDLGKMACYHPSWDLLSFHEIDISLNFVTHITDSGTAAAQYHNYYKTGGSQF